MEYIFNPTILECKRFIAKSDHMSSERITKDYEFDYYIDGDRQIYINDKYYHIKKGSLVLRLPKQRVYSYGDYNCYILTLDFTERILKNYTRHSAISIQPTFNSPIWNIIPPVFVPYHREDYIRIFEELLAIPYTNLNQDIKSKPLINEFLHLAITDALRRKNSKYLEDNDCIDDICNFIKKHYMENITLDTLAKIVHLNKNYLTRKFKKKIGITPIAYLIQIRLENAKTLLSETDYTIKNISELCGYNDPAFFNYYFKNFYNITPLQYRNFYKR